MFTEQFLLDKWRVYYLSVILQIGKSLISCLAYVHGINYVWNIFVSQISVIHKL